MREIKFRVFDKKNKKMLEVETLFINEKMFRPIDGSEYDVWNYDTEYFSNPLQYTGLKDKNGVEIYEGDILKFKYTSSDYKKAYIEWNEEKASYDFVDNETKLNYSYNFRQINNIEAIGNIYENKDKL